MLVTGTMWPLVHLEKKAPESLKSAGRQVEAATVELLWLYAVALAADSPERIAPEVTPG